MLTSYADESGIDSGLIDELPDDAARIEIMKSDELSSAQSAVRIIHQLALFIPIAALLFLSTAIYISRGARWTTVTAIGVSLIGVGLTVLAVRHVGGNQIVDQLASTQSAKSAGQAVWSLGTSLLVKIATAVALIGCTFVVGGWLGSPDRRARATRDRSRMWSKLS